MAATEAHRRPVSVVCVYNDAEVLADCLVRSVTAGRPSAPETELITVDNRLQQFSSAGAALNHGARLARHDVVVFVHQDVYLHSLPALERAARLLVDGRAAVVGAVGITSAGNVAGTIRDRVILDGLKAENPIEVESLDEVLFAVSTAHVLAEPLIEQPALAWHAYAVEYGLRARRGGGRVVAADIPLTHNSLSVNLARLELAHQTVGVLYPELLPVRTTCGTIGARRRGLPAGLEPHRWRYRWLRQSLATLPIHRALGRGEVVLSDIRETVDRLLARAEGKTLQVLNVTDDVDTALRATVTLSRHGRPLAVSAGELREVVARVRSDSDSSYLVTNLEVRDARELCQMDDRPAAVGFSSGTGAWCLLGPLALVSSLTYDEVAARPLDLRPRSLAAPGSRGVVR